MGVNISYMGTKKELIPSISEAIDRAKPGVLLDVFSGMCSVGEAVSAKRQIWTNDVQVFSSEVASALFTSVDEPLSPVQVADMHFEKYKMHKYFLEQKLEKSLSAELALLSAASFEEFSDLYEYFKYNIKSEKIFIEDIEFSLFSSLYSDTYFGVRQSIEIDSIVRSIDCSFRGGAVTADRVRWLKVALGRAMLRVSNSTGHFAQFLKPKAKSYRTFVRQRARTVWVEWLASIDDMGPVGDSEWRKSNRSFNEDSLSLLLKIKDFEEKPSVVYADPPYTDDQYSRYYHLLETLMLYDYPDLSGAGCYRPNRFCTPFSIKTKTVQALDNLLRDIAAIGADIVLSYPTHGLLYEACGDPKSLLKRHFSAVELCHALPHNHSTFGASKGPSKSAVTEQIYLGRL